MAVLVETESITNRILSGYFSARGAPIEEDQVHHLFSGGTMKTAGEQARQMGARLAEDWMDEIYDLMFDALRKGVEVFPGVIELLDLLDDKAIAVAVASNGPMAKMEISLVPSGIWDRLSGRIYSGHTHGAPKPAPDLLLHAAKVAGVAPHASIMIDDTTAGTRAADAAGMHAIGFAAASDLSKLQMTGHPTAMTMDEVTALLGLA